jgi:hypothetical protein
VCVDTQRISTRLAARRHLRQGERRGDDSSCQRVRYLKTTHTTTRELSEARHERMTLAHT